MKRLSFTLLMLALSLFVFAQNKEFPAPDTKAVFPGGIAEMQAFILDHLYYPSRCAQLNIQGKVLVRFVVDKDGKIINPEVESSPHEDLSREALRVVSMMPKWIPAKLRGKSIKSRFMLPVTFKLNTNPSANSQDVNVVIDDINMKSEGCKENPKGLYRLAALSFSNGKPSMLPYFSQYKLCTNSIDIQINLNHDLKEETAFIFYNNDSQKIRYTGDVDVPCDSSKHGGHGTRVYDSNRQAFKMKWYNVEEISKSLFPLNAYTTEYYDADESKIPQSIRRTLSLMKDVPAHTAENRFFGCWYCEGLKKVNSNDLLPYTYDKYSIYDKDVYVSILDNSKQENKLYGVVFLRPVVYNEDGSILEWPEDGSQLVEWVDDNKFLKSHFDKVGNKFTEVWTRQALPANYQQVLQDK